jgi:hypothetical protein
MFMNKGTFVLWCASVGGASAFTTRKYGWIHSEGIRVVNLIRNLKKKLLSAYIYLT